MCSCKKDISKIHVITSIITTHPPALFQDNPAAVTGLEMLTRAPQDYSVQPNDTINAKNT